MVRTRLTTGGFAEPVVADTAKSLAKQGHRVILLAWDRTGKCETTTSTEWGTIWRYQEECHLNKPITFAKKLPSFLTWSTWQIIAFQNIEKDVILHYHDLDTLVAGVFTSKLIRVPLVYDCHENYPGLVEGAISSGIAKGLHKLEARLLKYCDGIISAGPANYARIRNMIKDGTKAPFAASDEESFQVLNMSQREFLNAKLTRVGNLKRLEAYPERRIEKRQRNGDFRLLYIGVLEKHPARGIIEASLTIGKMKGIQFDIGGFGTLVPTLKKLSAKIKNVDYIGSIHPDNVPLQTIECDAVLMALDPQNINNKSSAPNKLFEAMAAGVPIITCKELLMGQFVEREEIGLTFEWGKWDRLKAVLMKLMFDEGLCKRLGKRGRKLAEKKHNWDYCEERIESLYRYVKITED